MNVDLQKKLKIFEKITIGNIFLIMLIVLISQTLNFQFIETNGQNQDFECDINIDKNKDNIPDKIEPRSSINWSYCNLEGKDISKIKSFDYTDSDRPFDKLGVPYDNHESEYNLNPKIEYYDFERSQDAKKYSILDKIIRNILELFGKEYDKSDFNNNFFKGANLKSADLTGANLKNAKIIDSNFYYATLDNADLRNSNLTGSSFYKASLKNVDFSYADLRHVQLYEADLENAIFEGVNLAFSNLCDYSEDHMDMLHDFGVEAFSGVDLSYANFDKADLRNVDFEGVIIHNAHFLFADLTNSNLSGRNLTGTNFGYADLTGADLSNTILSNADLHDTILVNADLSGADLSGVDLSGRDLSGTKLSGER